jgi:hypothetical protein
MGDSKPPNADFDLVDSYARRRGADIEIFLADPHADLQAATALTLSRSGDEVQVAMEPAQSPNGPVLVARVPADRLTNGRWTLHATSESGSKQISARLLLQGRRPVVLLWGAHGSATEVPERARPATPKEGVASLGGKVLDVAVSALPAERAQKIRGAARDAARADPGRRGPPGRGPTRVNR